MEEKQAIDLLWEEWKYRHELLWRSLFRWAGAVITLWIIPFLKPDVFRPFPCLSLVFPFSALLLSLLSAWYLAGEQYRFGLVNERYKDLRGAYLPKSATNKWRDKLLGFHIGIVVVWFYGIAFTLISLTDAYVLLRFIEQVPHPAAKMGL